MATKDGTFEDNFARRMPLEIKHMVFKWAVSGNGDKGGITDIEVELAHDNKQSLKSPALDLLATLARWYPADVHKEAVGYLTSPLFRWVFISDKEPHHSLLAVFRKQISTRIRKRIKHVYLRKLRVSSLIHKAEFPITNGDLESLELPQVSDYSDYLRRIDKDGTRNLSDVRLAVLEEILEGMLLLPRALPSITKFDVGLDIFDCLLEVQHFEQSLSSLIDELQADPQDLSLYAAYSIAIWPFKRLRGVSNINIQVVWDNHFRQEADLGATDEEKEKLQDIFVTFMRRQIPAKSITSYVQK